MSEPLRLPLTTGYEVEDAKAELRRVIRERRRSRTAREIEDFGRDFVSSGLQAVGDARTIALYVSSGWEPPTLPLLDELYSRGVQVLLPSLGPGLARQWAVYMGSQDLTPRAPSRPPEPSGPRLPADAIRNAEVIITPALAVDGLGNRLGQGGGWYDRMLKLIDPATPTFAMVFEDELVSTQALPHDDMDVAVKAVLTPLAVFLLEGSRLERETRAAGAVYVGGHLR
ncbi:MAG TPA: 5-formyltetrahydrofolate cyclo-ligase [Actinomycetaceae bacterium]|nr:5-formyltetrahydrofolate cyclo-ligase [Actinomycetaceae bacterium]